MGTKPWKLKQFGVPLFIIVLGLALGWYVRLLSALAAVAVLAVAKHFGKFEARLAAIAFRIAVVFVASIGDSESQPRGGLLESAICVTSVWIAFALATKRDGARSSVTNLKPEELQPRDVMWQALVETFPGWMWTAYPDRTIEYSSPGIQSYLSRTSRFNKDIGQIYTSAVHPDDLEHHRRHWEEQLGCRR